MNEYEIAMKKVLPFILDNLGWPEFLVSKYGRVPVQVGGSTIWADFVCYISKGDNLTPWILFEVKQEGVPLAHVIPQAESYSLILGVPFFCVTDGNDFLFHVAGDSQGKSISIQGSPPIPSSNYLSTHVEYTFPSKIDDLIESFLVGLKEEKKFLDDTRRHDESVKRLYKNSNRSVAL